MLSVLLLLISTARGCEPAAPEEPVRVYLVTTAPGESLFNRFGHSALWVSGGGLPEDLVFNWGSYDSTKQDPTRDFILGRMDYGLALDSWKYVADKAKRHDRTMVLQDLSLPPVAVQRLQALLTEAWLPENRLYRYHWREDNCSTRIRDLLDRALEGGLRGQHARADFREADPESARTAREEVLRHLAPDPLVWFGWTFMAPSSADESLTAWESMFLPSRLMEAMDATTVAWPDGSQRPLVDRTCVERTGANHWRPLQMPDRRWIMALLGLIWGGLALLLGSFGRRRTLGLVAATLGLVGGALGTATMALWWLSAIEGLGPNENWFQASPLTLLLAGAGLVMGVTRRGTRFAQAVAMGLVWMALLGLVVSLGPVTNQRSAEVIALFLPALVGTWLGLRRLRRAGAASAPSNHRDREATGSGGTTGRTP